MPHLLICKVIEDNMNVLLLYLNAEEARWGPSTSSSLSPNNILPPGHGGARRNLINSLLEQAGSLPVSLRNLNIEQLDTLLINVHHSGWFITMLPLNDVWVPQRNPANYIWYSFTNFIDALLHEPWDTRLALPYTPPAFAPCRLCVYMFNRNLSDTLNGVHILEERVSALAPPPPPPLQADNNLVNVHAIPEQPFVPPAAPVLEQDVDNIGQGLALVQLDVPPPLREFPHEVLEAVLGQDFNAHDAVDRAILMMQERSDIGNVRELIEQNWDDWDAEYRQRLLDAVRLLTRAPFIRLLRNGLPPGYVIRNHFPRITEANYATYGLLGDIESCIPEGCNDQRQRFTLFDGPVGSNLIVVEWPRGARATYVFRYGAWNQSTKEQLIARIRYFGLQRRYVTWHNVAHNTSFDELRDTAADAYQREEFEALIAGIFNIDDYDLDVPDAGCGHYTGFLGKICHTAAHMAALLALANLPADGHLPGDEGLEEEDDAAQGGGELDQGEGPGGGERGVAPGGGGCGVAPGGGGRGEGPGGGGGRGEAPGGVGGRGEGPGGGGGRGVAPVGGGGRGEGPGGGGRGVAPGGGGGRVEGLWGGGGRGEAPGGAVSYSTPVTQSNHQGTDTPATNQASPRIVAGNFAEHGLSGIIGSHGTGAREFTLFAGPIGSNLIVLEWPTGTKATYVFRYGPYNQSNREQLVSRIVNYEANTIGKGWNAVLDNLLMDDVAGSIGPVSRREALLQRVHTAITDEGYSISQGPVKVGDYLGYIDKLNHMQGADGANFRRRLLELLPLADRRRLATPTTPTVVTAGEEKQEDCGNAVIRRLEPELVIVATNQQAPVSSGDATAFTTTTSSTPAVTNNTTTTTTTPLPLAAELLRSADHDIHHTDDATISDDMHGLADPIGVSDLTSTLLAAITTSIQAALEVGISHREIQYAIARAYD